MCEHTKQLQYWPLFPHHQQWGSDPPVYLRLLHSTPALPAFTSPVGEAPGAATVVSPSPPPFPLTGRDHPPGERFLPTLGEGATNATTKGRRLLALLIKGRKQPGEGPPQKAAGRASGSLPRAA